MTPASRSVTTSRTSTGFAAGREEQIAMAAIATYSYSVRDRAGKLVSGTLEAESESAVARRLKGMGYAPVSIAEANAGLSKEIKIPGFSRGKKIKLKDLAVFSR